MVGGSEKSYKTNSEAGKTVRRRTLEREEEQQSHVQSAESQFRDTGCPRVRWRHLVGGPSCVGTLCLIGTLRVPGSTGMDSLSGAIKIDCVD